VVEEEDSLEPAPPLAPPLRCFWQASGAAPCPSLSRIPGCSSGACGASHCKLLVLRRGLPACSVHPIPRAEFNNQ
jgi:hypothetical protein